MLIKIKGTLLCLIIIYVESARILGVFPTPSISHQISFRPLMVELAKRGHEVVVITTDPILNENIKIGNYTEIDVHDISYNYKGNMLSLANGKEEYAIYHILEFTKVVFDIFEEQVKSNQIQKFISDKSQKFDLLIIEQCVRPALSFSHIFKVPVIQFSSLGGMYGTYEEIGAETHPFHYPLFFQTKNYNITTWEKVKRLYFEIFITGRGNKNQEENENERLKKLFGHNIPQLSDLKKNVHMTFLNNYPVWDSNRPVPPDVIYVGGISQTSQQDLPQDLEDYLNNSTNGVIYMSFGTNCVSKLLPPKLIAKFIKVFSELPYNILLKWDAEELSRTSKNIRVGKWFPQQQLLRHPNIKVFITQGGLQSTEDAIEAAVPVISMPILIDQWFNSEKYVHYKFGIKLNMHTLTKEIIKHAITTVIKDKSYRENMIKFRSFVKDQPMTPIERAVWWTEHLLRHGGGTHLHARSRHTSWMEYYEINLLLIVITVIVASFMVIMYIIRLLFKHCLQSKVKVD